MDSCEVERGHVPIVESSSSNPFAFDNDSENKSVNNQNAGKATPLVLAQRILSKGNLEQLCHALAKRPALVANGCDFLILVLDLLGRNMPLPIRVSLIAPFSDQLHSSDKNGNEQMQVEGETPCNKQRHDNDFFRLMMTEVLHGRPRST